MARQDLAADARFRSAVDGRRCRGVVHLCAKRLGQFGAARDGGRCRAPTMTARRAMFLIKLAAMLIVGCGLRSVDAWAKARRIR